MSIYKIKSWYNKKDLEKLSSVKDWKGELLPIIDFIKNKENKFNDNVQENSPFLFSQINDIINFFINKDKKILIFGDPDLDWLFSSILLYKSLIYLWYKVEKYLPKKGEGHWISNEQIDLFKKQKIDYIILTDNWTNEENQRIYAKSLGIETFVFDHHLQLNKIDKKFNFLYLNPKIETETYPFKDLVSTTIRYKFCQILFERNKKIMPETFKNEFIDFIILTTISDKAMLQNENLFFIKQFSHTYKFSNKIIRILFEKISNENPLEFSKNKLLKTISIINSSIRMNKIDELFNIMLTENPDNIPSNILFLYKQDEERRELQNKLKDEIDYSKINLNKPYIFSYSPDYEDWFLGLFATFLSQENEKIVFFAKDFWDFIKGSVRTYNGINVFTILKNRNIPTLVFKGHIWAFWFEIKKEHIKTLKKVLDEEIPEIEKELLNVDYELNFSQINIDNIIPIENEIWWNWKEEPLFISENVTLNYFTLFWSDNKNANLFLKQNWKTIKFVYFNCFNKIDLIQSKPFKIIYKLKLYINKKIWIYMCQPVIKEIII